MGSARGPSFGGVFGSLPCGVPVLPGVWFYRGSFRSLCVWFWFRGSFVFVLLAVRVARLRLVSCPAVWPGFFLFSSSASGVCSGVGWCSQALVLGRWPSGGGATSESSDVGDPCWLIGGLLTLSWIGLEFCCLHRLPWICPAAAAHPTPRLALVGVGDPM